MGNSLLAGYDRHGNRDVMSNWKKERDRGRTLNDDGVVAKPLRAPYTPAEMKSRDPLFVQSAFTHRSNRFFPLRTSFNVTPQNPDENRFIQTHNIFHVDKSDRMMCPVSITSRRHLDPVRVGAGIVLTQVVQVLEEIPFHEDDQTLSGSKFYSVPSSRSDELSTEDIILSADHTSRPYLYPENSSRNISQKRNSSENKSSVRVPPNSASTIDPSMFNSRRNRRS